jgi:predicted nuclease of predicted toxin-antitoxin system
VRYAAETDRRANDTELLTLANAEDRIIVTEDFDFGDLLIRDGYEAPGVIILYLPDQTPLERAARLVAILSRADFDPRLTLSIVERRRLRQRRLPPG